MTLKETPVSNSGAVVFETEEEVANQPLITLSPVIRLHWDGAPMHVYSYLDYMQRAGLFHSAYHAAARLCQVAGNNYMSMASVTAEPSRDLDYDAEEDNGLYLVDLFGTIGMFAPGVIKYSVRRYKIGIGWATEDEQAKEYANATALARMEGFDAGIIATMRSAEENK